MRRSGKRELRARVTGLAVLLLVLLSGGPSAAQEYALALEGVDEIEALVPTAARIAPYANHGYRLWLDGDRVRVRVDNTHLGSRAPFVAPSPQGNRFTKLASSLTLHSDTVYDAASEVLAWVARTIRYDLDRSQSQTAESVLARRSGYCTGIAKLTVKILQAAGIEAREVAGYVFRDRPEDVEGYHRWVEIHYPDRGWAFSDPSSSHHFVPATYVRLASDRLDLSKPREGLLLARSDRLEPRDIYLDAPSSVRARKNTERQVAASLRVEIAGASKGSVVLQRPGTRLRVALSSGRAHFTGLEPGDYVLTVHLPGAEVLRRHVQLTRRVRADVSMQATLRGSRTGS